MTRAQKLAFLQSPELYAWALRSTVIGLRAMARTGVSFTPKQRDLIQGLLDSGRVAEAQGLVLDGPAAEFEA